jgi:two-component system KDP operon response regulator KdpE
MDWTEKSILIIEDDKQMGDLLATIFGREGATPHCVLDGESGLRRLYQHRPDLIILDLLLPGIGGIEVLKMIRLVSDVPLIILTALRGQELLCTALENGADDYLTKPFQTGELLARGYASLRRAQVNGGLGHEVAYADDILTVNQEKRQVTVSGAHISLTRTEFDLLIYLIRYAGLLRTYKQIQSDVWHDDSGGPADNIHVFTWQLRKKIEPNPCQPRYILNEHGLGYRFLIQKPG